MGDSQERRDNNVLVNETALETIEDTCPIDDPNNEVILFNAPPRDSDNSLERVPSKFPTSASAAQIGALKT